MELANIKKSAVAPLLGRGDALIQNLEKTKPITEIIDELYALLRELLFIRHSTAYLYPLKDFIDICRPLDIFTLNYDLTLETTFDELDIRYTTGYRKRDGKTAVWDPLELEQDSFDVRIYKLHGSINWGQFFKQKPPVRSDNSGIFSSADSFFTTIRYMESYPENIMFDPVQQYLVNPPNSTIEMVSIMNFGTRKELLYSSSQFIKLITYLLNSLNVARVCVIAGYSFGDEKINDAIIDMIITKQGYLHLVIVDPYVDSIVNKDQRLAVLWGLGWVTKLDRTLGEVLNDDTLLDIVKNPTDYMSIKDAVNSANLYEQNLGIDGHDDYPFGDVIDATKYLNIHLNITHFWWVDQIYPNINSILKESMENAEKAMQLGSLFCPLIRKVRDLCYHMDQLCGKILGDLYSELCSNEKYLYCTYNEIQLKTIKMLPEFKGTADIESINRIVSNLNRKISDLINVSTSDIRKFYRAVYDPNSGYQFYMSNSPYIQFTEFTENIGDCIYNVLIELNNMYVVLGYDGPFESIVIDKSRKIS